MTDDPVTVFVVSNGSYSDYRISSIWTTREAAEIEAGEKRNQWDGPWIEEWVLNDKTPTPVLRWSAHLERDGSIKVHDKPSLDQEIQRTEVSWNVQWHAWSGWGWGSTAEHARKNLADAVAQAKAGAANQT